MQGWGEENTIHFSALHKKEQRTESNIPHFTTSKKFYVESPIIAMILKTVEWSCYITTW